MNLPAYTEKIWVQENSEYLQLIMVKERRKSEKELEAEEEEDTNDGDSRKGDLTQEQITEDQWKDVKKYTPDMQVMGKLMKVNMKLTVKKVYKKGLTPHICDPSEWDALTWDVQEKCPFIHVFHVCGRIYFAANTVPHFRR
jgi:hypothetical protein